jgi:hypothetical protein
MKLCEQRFRKSRGNRPDLPRRLQAYRVELQRAVEGIEEGKQAGHLPDPLAAMLIARLEKRALLYLGFGLSHAR